MKIKSLVVCESCIIDAQSNNISFINIIEEFHAIGFPIIIPKLTVVVLLERKSVEENEIVPMNIKATINGDEILDKQINPDFKGKLKARLYDAKKKKIKDVDVKEMINAIEKSKKKVDTVLFDGIITKRLLEVSEAKGVKNIVGVRKSSSSSEKVNTYTM